MTRHAHTSVGSPPVLSRREFLRISAQSGALLVAGVAIGCRQPGSGATDDVSLSPDLYVAVQPSGRVRVWSTKSEMGQGIRTAIAMIVAEELDAAWADVAVIQAAVVPQFGEQRTGGSTSVRLLWEPLRQAGAKARAMLVTAAAERWRVAAEECRTERGAVIHASTGRRVAYGRLVRAAARVPVPEHPALKAASEFRMLGTSPPRIDTPSKLDGSAVYGLDVRVPGMLFAMLARPPVFGARLRGFDPDAAQAIPGVRDAFRLDNAVAVVALNSWAAIKGREALKPTWDIPQRLIDSAALSRTMTDLARRPGRIARDDGNVARALATAALHIAADYELPFLAHAPMEPMNCTAHARDGQCELWAPTQVPTAAVNAVSEALGIPPEAVTLHVTLMGGGFGRRLQADYVVEAALISRGARAPVQLFWTREDDIGGGWYRPASLHRMEGGLDADRRAVAWSHRIVTPSITGKAPSGLDEDTFSPFATAGFAALPYAIPNLRVEYRSVNVPVPVGWWRSVYASQYAFANECFIDELAAAAGVDPLAFRRSILGAHPRARRVLDLAAERARWEARLPAGRGRGIALAEFFDTWVAHVAEVSVSPEGELRVDRITVAVDCGFVVHPGQVEAQIVGGTIDGLCAALQGEITLRGGSSVQKNLDGYRLLRMGEVPPIDVHIVPSHEPPTGVGEPGVPGAAPAVANALYAAAGLRLRKLPLGPGPHKPSRGIITEG